MKAYNMVWEEGLLIGLCQLGIKGQMYRWIKDFLVGGLIQVKIGESCIFSWKDEDNLINKEKNL